MAFEFSIEHNSTTRNPDVIAGSSPLEQLEDELTTLAGHLNAGNYRFLKLLAEFERREGYAGWGIVSCAHWLSWRCGLSLVAARERCRIARALEELPLISDAMRAGRVSYCKVRAITRVATPDNEALLLQVAEHGTVTHVETTVRLYRKAQSAEQLEQANQVYRERQLNHFVDDDGSFVIRGRLHPEQGALLRKALEAAARELHEQENASREARAEPAAARNADALVLLAETFLAHGSAARAAGDRHLITVHVDEQVLRGGEADTHEPRCELEDMGSLHPATVRRLCCDASLTTIVGDADGAALHLGRKTRVVPPAMHRALVARDVGCRFPGCTNTRFVDAHHIVHWADGGETSLRNLTLLCRRHHRYVHELGFSIERHGTRLRFTKPDGQHIPDVVPPCQCDGDASQQMLAQAGVHIDARTATPRWDGRAPDYRWLVGSLCRMNERDLA